CRALFGPDVFGVEAVNGAVEVLYRDSLEVRGAEVRGEVLFEPGHEPRGTPLGGFGVQILFKKRQDGVVRGDFVPIAAKADVELIRLRILEEYAERCLFRSIQLGAQDRKAGLVQGDEHVYLIGRETGYLRGNNLCGLEF